MPKDTQSALTIEDQIWLSLNKVTLTHKKRSVTATIDFGYELLVDKRRVRYDLATIEGESEVDAIQQLCDQNNILSPFEIRKLKKLLK